MLRSCPIRQNTSPAGRGDDGRRHRRNSQKRVIIRRDYASENRDHGHHLVHALSVAFTKRSLSGTSHQVHYTNLGLKPTYFTYLLVLYEYDRYKSTNMKVALQYHVGKSNSRTFLADFPAHSQKKNSEGTTLFEPNDKIKWKIHLSQCFPDSGILLSRKTSWVDCGCMLREDCLRDNCSSRQHLRTSVVL